MLFDTETYRNRRRELARRVGKGLIVLPGNNESPCNYPSNIYKFRQDSTFLYYFGLHGAGLTGVIDAETGEDWLLGNDIDIEDIVWFGTVEPVAEMGRRAGVAKTAPDKKLDELVAAARKAGRDVHFLPPYRHDTMIRIMDLTGIHPRDQRAKASVDLIKAVVDQRAVKSADEIREMERAAEIGYAMHTTAMRLCRPDVPEQEVAAAVDAMANAMGSQVAFPTILTMHGEIMHGIPTTAKLEEGRLMLCDCGGETLEHYCSDNTRTSPIGGRYSTRQREIHDIVADCHDHALTIARPGVKWLDVHMGVCTMMTDRLKELGLMKGDTEEAVRNGAHALFMPHGLGHMIGMDVHDMEGLGQNYVGFDDEVQPSSQFGTASLRCGRRLQEGWVMTDEPGIYFIPDLIDEWRAKGINKDFLNFDAIEKYKDFGGVRLENDILITADGCRMVGEKRIPMRADEVEAFMAQ